MVSLTGIDVNRDIASYETSSSFESNFKSLILFAKVNVSLILYSLLDNGCK